MAEPDGTSVMHAELQIGDSRLFLCEEYPDMGARGPRSVGGSPVTIHMYVEDVDTAFQHAVEAGAEVTMPVKDQFWGDRYGKLTDPFGHHWSLASHVEDLTPDEIAKRAATAMGGCGKSTCS